MNMNKLHVGAGAALIGLMMSLVACGGPSSDSADTPETPQPPIATDSGSDRQSKAAALADFEASLTRARATDGPGAPAMWTLSDEDTTISIFGTVHILRPELEWRTLAFDAALANADRIVFEVDTKSEAAIRAITTDFLARGMFDDGRTLRGILSDDDEAVIAAAFESIGVPLDAMNTFEPWMASTNLSTLKLMNDGYDPNSGVETVIEQEAAAAEKSFGYLEHISQQADALDLLPEADQIAMLYSTALLIDETSEMLDLLVDEWADGDIAGLGSLVASPDGVGISDAMYDSLFVKRNQAWVPQIEAMLEEPGAVLIAVGAGHLAGPDSVITMLRDKGYTIEGP